MPWPRHGLGTRDGQSGEAEEQQELRPRFGLAAKKLRAIDLSCRACDACGAGAGCWAWIPGGGLRSAPFSPPTSHKTKLKLDKEVGGGDLSELCTITYLIAYPYA